MNSGRSGGASSFDEIGKFSALSPTQKTERSWRFGNLSLT